MLVTEITGAVFAITFCQASGCLCRLSALPLWECDQYQITLLSHKRLHQQLLCSHTLTNSNPTADRMPCLMLDNQCQLLHGQSPLTCQQRRHSICPECHYSQSKTQQGQCGFISAMVFFNVDFMRDSIYAIVRICYRPTVCPSHWWISQKMLKLGSQDFLGELTALPQTPQKCVQKFANSRGPTSKGRGGGGRKGEGLGKGRVASWLLGDRHPWVASMSLELFVKSLYTRTSVVRHPCFIWAFLYW